MTIVRLLELTSLLAGVIFFHVLATIAAIRRRPPAADDGSPTPPAVTRWLAAVPVLGLWVALRQGGAGRLLALVSLGALAVYVALRSAS